MHWVRDFTEAEAAEATNWRRGEVQAAEANTGLRPGLLQQLTRASAAELVQQAGQELQKLVSPPAGFGRGWPTPPPTNVGLG